MKRLGMLAAVMVLLTLDAASDPQATIHEKSGGTVTSFGRGIARTNQEIAGSTPPGVLPAAPEPPDWMLPVCIFLVTTFIARRQLETLTP